MKVLSGAVRLDAGENHMGHEPVGLRNAARRTDCGIETVFRISRSRRTATWSRTASSAGT